MKKKTPKSKPSGEAKPAAPELSSITPALHALAVPIESLVPDPRNARRHGDRNRDAIRSSLAKFGQQRPISVDADGVVLAGNGTLAAARELGWTHIAVVRSHLRGAQARAYAIADNRTGELAEWDAQQLAAQLEEIADADAGISLEDLAFTDDEVDRLLAEAAGEVVQATKRRSDGATKGKTADDEGGTDDAGGNEQPTTNNTHPALRQRPERWGLMVQFETEAEQTTALDALERGDGEGLVLALKTAREVRPLVPQEG